MKYGESCFDIFYLLTAIIVGLLILRKAKSSPERLMGLAVLILGCGDAFHLVPRVLNYFVSADLTAALGIGKMVTSITMTVFYVLLYKIGCLYDHSGWARSLRPEVWSLAAIRIVLCLFPQNGWLSNDSSMFWSVLRNIPFVILGILVMILYYRDRGQMGCLSRIWIYILLSFAFYIPVAVFAGVVPMLGMLMLPKTICYLCMIFAFYKCVIGDVSV